MDQAPPHTASENRHGSNPASPSRDTLPPLSPAAAGGHHQQPHLPAHSNNAAGRTISTHSTDSARTLRGTAAALAGGGGGAADAASDPPSTSYPFPFPAAQPGTPAFTPGAHQPFTALSPTVSPSPAKAAKHKISHEFRASGIVRASTAASTASTASQPRPLAPEPATTFGSAGGRTLSRPNLLELAVHLQSELGLPHWWHQVSKTLKDHLGAERATLAVATDVTDVENVPWAQLATFWDGDDDGMSRVTNEAQSSRGSMRDVSSPAQSAVDKSAGTGGAAAAGGGGGGVAAAHMHRKQSGLMGAILPSRPKLETRHSYAGYPSRHKPTASDSLLQPSSATSAQRPLSPTINSVAFMSRDHLAGEPRPALNEELLRRHNDEDHAVTSISDDFFPGIRSLSGTILQPPQPLESEADPLITAAGVLRVLGRDRPVVLTREYLSHDPESPGATKDAPARASPGKAKPKRSPGLFGSRAAAPKGASRRHGVNSSGKDAAGADKPLPKSSAARKPAQTPVYDDYEQFPGTPWAQSPAPSPAARPDPDESPFFTHQPDPDAFAESPPDHPYAGQAQIAAIGVDRSRTIIQVPLIHPSARLSDVINSRSDREVSRNKQRRTHGQDSDQRLPGRHDSYLSSETLPAKRIPIAVLSMLAPNVPYPPELIESLTEMAPLLAASFYAARSHSNILLELSAVSGRSRRPNSLLSSREPSALGSMAGSIGLTFDRSRDRIFSPPSPISSASASTQSFGAFAGTKDQTGFHSAISSPVIDTSAEETGRRSTDRQSSGTEDGVHDAHMDYFSRRHSRSDKNAWSPSTPVKTPGSARNASGGTKRKIIHSHGASFATTQPSLPSASASVAEEAREGATPSDLSTFKEPSPSVLRTMIDNGATQQFIAEPEHGRLIWANSKFMAYRNAPKDNIHEQLWSNIYPKDIHRFQREWNKSLESGEQLSHQVRLKRFDGQYRYFHIRFLPLKDRYGVTKYWHGQAMDIHDLHEAEVKAAKSKEKAASEARYRAIANSLPVIVFAASVPSGMTFANTQWLSYSGQDLDEALGFGFLEHVHPEDLVKCRFPGFDPASKAIPQSQQAPPPPLSRNDSSVSSTGESEETTATIKDIDTLKQANGELGIPNELLRQLADDGIILCAKDQQGNLSITTEMRLKNRRGEYKWHLVQGSLIDSVNFGQGEAQWFIACTDISNQKHNEAKIQQANSALEDVNSALEKEMKQKMNYLSSMSHEIRTPLNGIIGNLQFLINSGLEESAADWAHGAQEAARNMHDLINDILDLSKAEANMLQLASHWFNTRGHMEQVLDMLNSKAAEKSIELSFECDDDVPQAVKGDSQRIRQVLLNLVGNAIKFTEVGEVTIKCDMLQELPPGFALPDARADERFIRWTVSDTGGGFTAEDRKLLFKPYSQLKNRNTQNSGGTGLGLLLCKTMVTLHGGAIDATSRPGLGSTFTFFARFRVRPETGRSTRSFKGQIPFLASTPEPNPTSPTVRSVAASELRDSPAVLSDSSSVRSFISTDMKPSVRSSASTTDSAMSMKLTLPPHPSAPRSPDVLLSATTKAAEPISSSPKSSDSKMAGMMALGPADGRAIPAIPPRGDSLQRTVSMDLERANFRPPMISALVVCSADAARRVTSEQIRKAVPQSVPCNITSQPTVAGAFELLTGHEPIIFTHIVLRLASNDETLRAVKGILAEPQHSRTCVVVLAHQSQAKYLQKNAPELNLAELSKQDRVKLVMKPAHTFKLAKIFDPFNENSLKVTNPKEAKRQEEKRLQREAYDLFKTVLGNKGLRIIAVEDNELQMNMLYSFLAKICCLEVTKAWNGLECYELYTSHPPGYYSVLLTDIEMPIMDGLTMCRKIREWEGQQNRAPVNLVSLSAHTFSEGWNQSSEAGFSHYCAKPVQFRDLGHILLELTDPSVPHKFLRERQMPRPMLKKLGLLPLDEEDSDEEDEA